MEGSDLIKHLQHTALYDHPVSHFKVIETHLSWILLTGTIAYKIKKPIHFSFADFSSLDKRKYYCEEELRLNNRLAASLYISVVAITGSPLKPAWNGDGAIIEYALKMHEFDQTQLFSVLARDKMLTYCMIEKLANKISQFHLETDIALEDSHFGNEDSIMKSFEDNFKDCKSLTKNKVLLQKLDSLEATSWEPYEKIKPYLTQRKKSGMIKDCHGDLHLGNIVLFDYTPTVFDCIEFNADFRFIDVINDIAFLIMDLTLNKNEQKAYCFLNRYLETTGDYAGVRLLKFYEVYRAMVRAKVALLTPGPDSQKKFKAYLKFTESLIKKPSKTPLQLIITHGVSGSGKTTIAKILSLQLNAIQIRSDVERKRLFGTLSSEDLYSEETTENTYSRLVELSESILNSGYSVIVDATFLQQAHRTLFLKMAKKCKVGFVVLQLETSGKTLKKRIQLRLEHQNDASDSTIDVLEQQLKDIEPLSKEELGYSLKINTEKMVRPAGLAKKILAIVS